MKLNIRIGLIIILVLLLFLVRELSQNYFYDPLHQYFLSDYLHTALPEIQFTKFYLFLFLKYFLNSIISIGIIHLAFLKSRWSIFSIKFYVLSFLVLGLFLLFLLSTNFYNGYLLIFYVRRFLIQPIFLLILLPAFYYQILRN